MGELTVTCLRAGHGLIVQKEDCLPIRGQDRVHSCKTGNLPREPLSSAGAEGPVVNSHQAKSVMREQLSSSCHQRR